MQKIVLITGATSGYGLATAKKSKEEGNVYVSNKIVVIANK